MNFSDFPCFCWPYSLKRTGQVLCRMSVNLGLSDTFLIIRLGLGVSERKTTAGKCPSHHIISKVQDINMTHDCWCYLHHLAKCVLLRFLHWKGTLSSFHSIIFESKHEAQPTLKKWRVRFFLLEGGSSYINYLKFFWIDLSPPPLYWIACCPPAFPY